MRRHIHFKDVTELLTKSDCIVCTQDQFDQSIAKHIKHDLRYDNFMGRLRDNQVGERERYAHQNEYVAHTEIQEVVEWEFRRYINNSISRLQRGYEA